MQCASLVHLPLHAVLHSPRYFNPGMAIPPVSKPPQIHKRPDTYTLRLVAVPGKSRSQCSVKVLASAHFIWSAQNRFSDVSLLLLEDAKQVRPLLGLCRHFIQRALLHLLTFKV